MTANASATAPKFPAYNAPVAAPADNSFAAMLANTAPARQPAAANDGGGNASGHQNEKPAQPRNDASAADDRGGKDHDIPTKSGDAKSGAKTADARKADAKKNDADAGTKSIADASPVPDAQTPDTKTHDATASAAQPPAALAMLAVPQPPVPQTPPASAGDESGSPDDGLQAVEAAAISKNGAAKTGATPDAAENLPASAQNSTQNSTKNTDIKSASAQPHGAPSDPRMPNGVKADAEYPGNDGKKDGSDKNANGDSQTQGAAASSRPGDAPLPAPAPGNSAPQTASASAASPSAMASAASPASAPAAAPMISTTLQIVPQGTAAQAVPPDPALLAVAIAAKSGAGSKEFDIRLDPPELGRVEVRLSIDDSGKTNAHLTADQPQTLALLQKDSTSLQQALRDAGLDVARDGLNFSLRGETHQDGGSARAPVSRARTIGLRAVQTIEAASSPAPILLGAGTARLDIRV